MTVKELIRELSKFPSDVEVVYDAVESTMQVGSVEMRKQYQTSCFESIVRVVLGA